MANLKASAGPQFDLEIVKVFFGNIEFTFRRNFYVKGLLASARGIKMGL